MVKFTQSAPESRAAATDNNFPTVAVVGGGQLARMMQPPAVGLGVHLSVLAENVKDSAAQVIPRASVGSHIDRDAVFAIAESADVVTFDHEHVPANILAELLDKGVSVHPSPAALAHAQDKLIMRRRLQQAGIAAPAWVAARSIAEVEQFRAAHGGRCVVKTPRGGYDGKGVAMVGDDAGLQEVAAWFDRFDELLVEEAVNHVRELAVLIARSPSGQAAAWPIVHTVQQDGVCVEVIAPAPDMSEEFAAATTEMALRVAAELNVTGVMAVEGFQTADGRFLLNELAMRPHNSGHWTIEGSVTSQFEQHLRAVLDLPLGETSLRDRWCVMANVLGGQYPDMYHAYKHVMAHDPGVKVHMYGKDVKPGRKVGHVTVCGDDLDQVRARARHAADYFQGVIDG